MSDLRPTHPTQPIPLWIKLAVILGAILMAMGAVIARIHPEQLVSPNDLIPGGVNGAVRVYASYLTARNGALALALVGLLVLSARRALGQLMTVVAFIQFFDSILDFAEGRGPILSIGVLVYGIVYLLCAARLCGHPFWKGSAWRDRQT